MADYYCQTSVLIPFDTPEEKAWLEAQLTFRSGDFCGGCQQLWGNCICQDDDDQASSYDTGGWEFEEKTELRNGGERPAMWVTESEYINGEVLAQLVADYQTTFAREDFWECSFAYTCSKPHLDGFGGYQVLVHRGKIHYLGTGRELEQLASTLHALNDFVQTLPQHL